MAEYYKKNKNKFIVYSAKRHATKLNATPKWANHKYITLWYILAKAEELRTGKQVHVDHIVPLQGKIVCGLHCENNMQLLFKEDNLKKSNKYMESL